MSHRTYLVTANHSYDAIPLAAPYGQLSVSGTFSQPQVPAAYPLSLCALASPSLADAGPSTPNWPQPGGFGAGNYTTRATQSFSSSDYQNPAGGISQDGSCGSSLTLTSSPQILPITDNAVPQGYALYSWQNQYASSGGGGGNVFNAVYNITKGYLLPWQFVNIGINSTGDSSFGNSGTWYGGTSQGGMIYTGTNGWGGGEEGGFTGHAWVNISITSPNNMEIIEVSCINSYATCSVLGLPPNPGSRCARSGSSIASQGSSVIYYICNNVNVGNYNITAVASNYTIPWGFTGRCNSGGGCWSFAALNESLTNPATIAIGAAVFQNTTYKLNMQPPKISGAASATYLCGVSNSNSSSYPQLEAISSYANFSTAGQNGCAAGSGDGGLVEAAVGVNIPYSSASSINARRYSGGESSGGAQNGDFTVQFNLPSSGLGGIGFAVITCSGGLCQPAASAVGNNDGTRVPCSDVANAVGATLNSSVDIVACNFAGKSQDYTLSITGSQNAQSEQATTYLFSAPYS
jgi:hypothetical protein